MKIEFTIMGEPFGKQRPKHSKYSTYTPDETVQHEQLIQLAYKKIYRDFIFPKGTYISLTVVAYYGIPKNTSQKKRKLMNDKVIRPTKRPDWDNIGKLVSDALNKVAYYDDAQVTDALVKKYYSDIPRVEIIIKESD